MTKKQGKLRKNRIKAVQSGIGLSEYDKATGAESGESFLKSRFARVLLAGAGFLADAVSSFPFPFLFLKLYIFFLIYIFLV